MVSKNCLWISRSPTEPDTRALLDQDIKGEYSAIWIYVKLSDSVKGNDLLTEPIINEMLADEGKDEDDLESAIEDEDMVTNLLRY